jgi:FkbM family methyltransferase
MRLPEIECRRGTTDRDVTASIYQGGAYDLDVMPHGRAARFWYERQTAQPLIVDCGAYIGASAAWFASLWPRATVLALEPEQSNFDLLARNVAKLENVTPMHAAIGTSPGRAWVHDPGGFACGYRVSDVPGGQEVEVLTLGRLRGSYGDHVPFILKVDIEGGEGALFSQPVPPFPVVIVEPHDYLIRGKSLSRSMLRWAADSPVDMVVRGENLFFFNHEALHV